MKTNRFRMVAWLLLAVVFYAAAWWLGGLVANNRVDFAPLQTLAWKLGHVTSGAYLGYWIDRVAIGRIRDEHPEHRRIARAIIMLAAIMAVSGGL